MRSSKNTKPSSLLYQNQNVDQFTKNVDTSDRHEYQNVDQFTKNVETSDRHEYQNVDQFTKNVETSDRHAYQNVDQFTKNVDTSDRHEYQNVDQFTKNVNTSDKPKFSIKKIFSYLLPIAKILKTKLTKRKIYTEYPNTKLSTIDNIEHIYTGLSPIDNIEHIYTGLSPIDNAEDHSYINVLPKDDGKGLIPVFTEEAEYVLMDANKEKDLTKKNQENKVSKDIKQDVDEYLHPTISKADLEPMRRNHNTEFLTNDKRKLTKEEHIYDEVDSEHIYDEVDSEHIYDEVDSEHIYDEVDELGFVDNSMTIEDPKSVNLGKFK